MSVEKPRSVVASASVALALMLGAGGSLAADPVRDSFDRMLAPESPRAAPATKAPGPADPLLAALVIPLRDGIWPSRAVDPVADSFARMFSHEPSWATPAVDDRMADPLTAAVVWPLLRERQLAVASLSPHAGR